MKEKIIALLANQTTLEKKDIEPILETPPSQELGDYAFPCFILSKKLKKNPVEIAKELAQTIKDKQIEKVESKGPYLNFFINKKTFAKKILQEIDKKKEKYGLTTKGKGKTIVIDLSSPNIAKPFGIGHLRSTIIGSALSNIAFTQGYTTIKINYLGDWGTPFGKILAGYEKWGDKTKLKKQPVKHLYEIYVKATKDPTFDEIGREYFKRLENGDKSLVARWKEFRELSIKEFKQIYKLLNVDFNVYSGESAYNGKMGPVIKELEKKKLLERSENALIIDLSKENLGVGLIQKTDGTTLYLTRDITAAKHRHKTYKFHKMFYEVGAEQQLHFKQLFTTLTRMGYKWADDCEHIEHGLYLDKDGKKFSTRDGKTVFMQDILDETITLAKKELQKRGSLSEKEQNKRALAIARAAIIYGDLKNYRANSMVFDIEKFLSFEGNTGPYVLYTYARGKTILKKATKKKSLAITALSDAEIKVLKQLEQFPETLEKAYQQRAPNLVANYAYALAQAFNEFYHSDKVVGSPEESFRLALVESATQVLKNALALLHIEVLESM